MTEPRRLTDLKREAIVQAAIAEFLANGFEATSVDKVAARAQVSKRTLYNHFPSKEVLFAEILRVLWNESASRVDVPYQADAPLEAQLLKLVMQKLALLADESFLALARVAMSAVIHSPERAREIVSRLGEKEGGMLSWIRAAQSDGRLKPGDALFASHQLESLLKGMAFWPQVVMGQPKLTPTEQRKLAAATAAMFLAHYGV